MHLDEADDDPLRAFVLGLPRHPADWSDEQRAEYIRRLNAFNAARASNAQPVAA